MEESYSMKEMAARKFELPIGAIFSWDQLNDLKKVKIQVSELWKDHKRLFNFLQTLRIYAPLVGKKDIFDEWWKENRSKTIDPKKLAELFKKLQVRICRYCRNPFSHGRADRIYCSLSCKLHAYQDRREKRENIAI